MDGGPGSSTRGEGPGAGALVGLVAVGALAGPGCGPTNAEAGVAVALVSPIVLLIEAGFLLLLRKLWQRCASRPLAPPILGWGKLLAALLGIAGLAAAVGPAADGAQWLLLALWAFGTSHFAVALVAWRIWHAIRPRHSFVGGPALAFAILLLPALPLAAGAAPEEEASLIFALWVYPGYAGWVPGILLVLAFAEAGIRLAVLRRQRERRDAEQPTGGARDDETHGR
jgi:hypothetical protein